MQDDFERYADEIRDGLLEDGTPQDSDSDLLDAFQALEEFPEEEAKWLVPGWIPEGQITLLAADGGVGKTSIWIHIIAALSQGTNCMLEPFSPCKPRRTLFLTTEDSIRTVLKRKLRLANANMKNIIAPDFVKHPKLLRTLKFGSEELRKVIQWYRPALCVFDPVQGFIPPNINMGSRNDMRDCLAPLIALGEEFKTTFFIVCHTNKRKSAAGRDRIADSADLWDIARSVLMCGYTEEEGIRYLSQEKSNYGALQETVLFSIDEDGLPRKEGTSYKRDREYQQDALTANAAPKREECKAFLLETLDGGTMAVSELEDRAKEAGYSFTAIKTAKAELKKENRVRYFQTGSSRDGDKVWHIEALDIVRSDME